MKTGVIQNDSLFCTSKNYYQKKQYTERRKNGQDVQMNLRMRYFMWVSTALYYFQDCSPQVAKSGQENKSILFGDHWTRTVTALKQLPTQWAPHTVGAQEMSRGQGKDRLIHAMVSTWGNTDGSGGKNNRGPSFGFVTKVFVFFTKNNGMHSVMYHFCYHMYKILVFT